MSNSTTAPTAASRVARIEALLDAALEAVAKQIDEGTCSASTLREIIALAQKAGVSFGEHGQPLSAGADAVLASMDDIDLSLYQ